MNNFSQSNFLRFYLKLTFCFGLKKVIKSITSKLRKIRSRFYAYALKTSFKFYDTILTAPYIGKIIFK